MFDPMMFIGIALLIIGLILHITGIATSEWVIEPEGQKSFGLFTYFVHGENDSLAVGEWSFEVGAVQSLTVSAVVTGVSALVLMGGIILHTDSPNLPRAHQEFVIMVGVLSLMTGGFTVIGLVIYGVYFFIPAHVEQPKPGKARLGYSFFLCIAGGIIISIGGVVAWLSYRRRFAGHSSVHLVARDVDFSPHCSLSQDPPRTPGFMPQPYAPSRHPSSVPTKLMFQSSVDGITATDV